MYISEPTACDLAAVLERRICSALSVSAVSVKSAVGVVSELLKVWGG